MKIKLGGDTIRANRCETRISVFRRAGNESSLQHLDNPTREALFNVAIEYAAIENSSY
jgi:hypothetical protein